MQQRCSKRIVPFMLDMSEPVGGSHQWHALACASDREIDAVARAAERDLRSARSRVCFLGACRGSRRWHPDCFFFQHFANEAEALSDDGTNPALLLPIIPDHAPSGI